MFDAAAPNHPDPESASGASLADQLPADTYWQLVRTLRLTLPPPRTDDPENFARRDRAAIARVAALCPANAAEADLAAMFVAASEQWKDCLRLAQAPEITPEWAGKCRAQALAMMRQTQSALRLLLRMQEARRKLEANHTDHDRLAWSEHCAAGLMMEALAAQPPEELEPSEAPQAAPLFTSPPACGGRRARNALARWDPRWVRGAEPPSAAEPDPHPEPVAEPASELLAAAEDYAAEYPIRAALIRRIGRMQDAQHRICGKPLGECFFFTLPEDDLVQALIAARTPYLLALDEAYPNAVPRERARAA